MELGGGAGEGVRHIISMCAATTSIRSRIGISRSSDGCEIGDEGGENGAGLEVGGVGSVTRENDDSGVTTRGRFGGLPDWL